MLANLKLRTKIGVGYALIALVLATAVLITIWRVEHLARLSNHFIDVRTPTVRESLMLSRGINRSLSALRGWIIIGDAAFRKEREQCWTEEITPSLTILTKLTASMTKAQDSETLNKIKTLLDQLKVSQKEIEDIAQTIDNTPATKMIVQEGMPLVDKIDKTISAIIDIEKTLEATSERKTLLSIMSDVRGSMILSIANLRAYLISGDDSLKEQFLNRWNQSSEQVLKLEELTSFLTPDQEKYYQEFSESRNKYIQLAQKIIQIRSGSEWNLANTWLSTRAAPIANELNSLLDGMLANQKDQMIIEQNEVKQVTSNLKLTEWILLIAGVVFCFAAGVIISRSISRPIQDAVSAANRLAQGDLTIRFDGRETTDETGQLLSAMKVMVNNLRSLVKEIADATNALSSSSEELSSISTQMASSAEEMDNQSSSVASAAEEVSASVNTVASAAEQSSTSVTNIAAMTEEMSATFKTMADNARMTYENVKNMANSSDQISVGINTIASAAEEMTASLNEVAKNTLKASMVSRNANQRTDDINARMNALQEASKQIGKVVEVIKDIADQTNMLALNATIEAAGAGDAGKGFAVVAGEVKELARQSADATEEIAGQIEQIQTSTSEAFQAISEINKIITEIAQINESIAASAEEQTATASEISKSIALNAKTVRSVAENSKHSAKLVEDIANSTNETSKAAIQVSRHVDELARGVRDVAMSSAEAARGVVDISKNMAQISIASKETASGAAQTKSSSDELSKMAFSLSEIVKRFKLN